MSSSSSDSDCLFVGEKQVSKTPTGSAAFHALAGQQQVSDHSGKSNISHFQFWIQPNESK
jgi:hypothetical protein